MTEKELMSEVISDSANVLRFIDAIDNKFRRLVLKTTKFPVRKCYEYTSRKKNKWLIFLEARKKKEVRDMERLTLVACYDTPHGIYAVMPTYEKGNNRIIIYPPHFFSRYAKRCGIELSGIELMKRFFPENCSYVYAHKQITIDEEHIAIEVYGSTSEGVAMGIVSEHGNFLFRTFITYEMSKGEQIEKFAENERIRQEIHQNT
jgi:hypothetical protein